MARAALLSVLLGLLFIGARAQECTPIVDAATEAGLTTLLAALEAADLVDTIVSATNLTVFAPSNEAFNAALAALDITLEELVANGPLLTEILTYHVLDFILFAADIVDDASYQTLLGDASSCGVSAISADISEDVVTLVGGVTNATVVVTDVETCQGVVHVIDFVLLPCPVGEDPPAGVTVTMTPAPASAAEEEAETCTPLIEAAMGANLTTLLAAVDAAGLGDAIQAPGLTIFAPTNDAFDAAVESLGVTIDELVANTDVLTEILLYHVLGTTVRSGDIVPDTVAETLLGNDSSCGVSTLTFNPTDGVVVVGGASSATVVAPDVETCTAVVHVIDFVLLPCSLGEPEPMPEPAPPCTPLPEAAQGAGLTTLLAALEAAGLVDAVVSPAAPLTVFAPTNDAFDAALNALGVTLDDLVANTDLLKEILLYHVLGTTVRSGDIRPDTVAQALLGKDSSCGVSTLTFDLTDGVVVKGGETSATVVTADVETCSAVVHVIDFVLLPCPLPSPPPGHPSKTPRKTSPKKQKGSFVVDG